MANTLERKNGKATQAGTTVYTVPTGTTITIIGLRALNTDTAENHTVTIEVGGFNVSGVETPLPVGSGYEFTEGAKIVGKAGDTIVAYADDDTSVEVVVSFLAQSE